MAQVIFNMSSTKTLMSASSTGDADQSSIIIITTLNSVSKWWAGVGIILLTNYVVMEVTGLSYYVHTWIFLILIFWLNLQSKHFSSFFFFKLTFKRTYFLSFLISTGSRPLIHAKISLKERMKLCQLRGTLCINMLETATVFRYI